MMGEPPEADITLANHAAEIGGVFQGQVLRAGELDDLVDSAKSRIRGVRLQLHYRTEGRGTPFTEISDEGEYKADEFGRINTTFELRVPRDGPISYDGSLIRVIWEIEVRVDIKRGFDTKDEIPVLVLPTDGWGIYQGPHPYRRP